MANIAAEGLNACMYSNMSLEFGPTIEILAAHLTEMPLFTTCTLHLHVTG